MQYVKEKGHREISFYLFINLSITQGKQRANVRRTEEERYNKLHPLSLEKLKNNPPLVLRMLGS